MGLAVLLQQLSTLGQRLGAVSLAQNLRIQVDASQLSRVAHIRLLGFCTKPEKALPGPPLNSLDADPFPVAGGLFSLDVVCGLCRETCGMGREGAQPGDSLCGPSRGIPIN